MINITSPRVIHFTSWFLTLGCIPILSIYGRPLQKWAFAQIGVQQVALLFGITLFLLSIAIISNLVKTGGKKQLWTLLWLAAVFIAIQWQIPVVEERMHVILFGLFGFLSLRIFSLKTGLLICALVAVSDEMLQYYLPDRVGDMHDVYLNLISTLLGAVLAIYLHKINKDHLK